MPEGVVAERAVEIDLLQTGTDEIDDRRQDEDDKHEDQAEDQRRESRRVFGVRDHGHGESTNLGIVIPDPASSKTTRTRISQRTSSQRVPTMLVKSRGPSSNSTMATT